ncbi:DUF4932 domain-containing protein [Proteiniphilum sp.]|uniref:DUF4932 domain-containing protein n=1 Tax=Proteiniphilum sp. TaxID=1926877 RepID=UPI002B20A820|nr:DUF4932 domain-containing protein [Proteiniphilum sp.]MEA4918426.1 DUF4932 domain-containing protein [Proteiniphilum sp.]
MKKNALLIILSFLISITVLGQETKIKNQDLSNIFPKPKVDKRIELVSIVARLAGYQEYNEDYCKTYTKDIHSYFDKFKNHPLISLASKLRMENGIGFDAVMKIAFHINQPPKLTPKVEFNSDIPESRWGKDNALKFLELLRDFYVVSEFEKFYNDHADLYSITEERFLPIYKTLNIDWYNQYYGINPNGSFNVIIGLGNGGSNYGGKVIYPDKKEDVYAIMGTWIVDSTNLPVYKNENYFPTLVHEFNHSFVNPLIDKFSNQLENYGKAIYKLSKGNMRRQSYGTWKSMMYESLVRASVIRYLLKNDSYQTATNQLIEEIGNGFYWMQELVNLLYDYENNRSKYPTLENFMPVIVDFYDKIAKESETMYEIKK